MSGWKGRPARVDQLAATRGEERSRVIAELVETVRTQSGDLDALNTAVDALSRFGLEVVRPLLPLLGTGNPAETRIAAVLALGQVGSPEAVDEVLKLLLDDDPNVKYHAIEALGRLRSRKATPELARILRRGDYFLVFPAIAAVKSIADPAVLPELLLLLQDELVAEEAVEAIGACRHALALPALAESLEKGQPSWLKVVEACETILSHYDRLLWGAGAWETELSRRLGAGALDRLLSAELGELSQTAARGACRLLKALTVARDWRGEEAELALRRTLDFCSQAGISGRQFPLDRVAESRLEELAREAEPAQKVALTSILGNLGVERPAPHAITRVGGHPGEWVAQRRVPQAPASDEERRFAGVLLMRLMRDEDSEVRQAAAQAFGEASGALDIDDLLPFAGSAEPEIAAAIAAASDRLSPLTSDRWEELLSHEDPLYRRFAARAARGAATLERDALLERLEQETDEQVRTLLIDSAMHRRERIYPWLRSHWSSLTSAQTAQVVENLRLNSRGSAFWLALGLDSRDIWTRMQAARMCREHPGLALGFDEARLESMLRDPLPPVRAAALALLPDEDGCLDRLVKALDDEEPEVSRVALSRLGLLRGEKAHAELQRRFREMSETERESTLLTLADGLQEIAWRPGRGTPAAFEVASQAFQDVGLGAAAAQVLWHGSLMPTGEVRTLVREALRHLRADWLQPPVGADRGHAKGMASALSQEKAETEAGQACMMAMAMNLRAKTILWSGQTSTAWAERARLLGLVEIGPVMPAWHRSGDSEVAGPRYPEDAGVREIAGIITREFPPGHP